MNALGHLAQGVLAFFSIVRLCGAEACFDKRQRSFVAHIVVVIVLFVVGQYGQCIREQHFDASVDVWKYATCTLEYVNADAYGNVAALCAAGSRARSPESRRPHSRRPGSALAEPLGHGSGASQCSSARALQSLRAGASAYAYASAHDCSRSRDSTELGAAKPSKP